MDTYTDLIKKYLSGNEINYETGIQSLVELLFWHYTQWNPPKDPEISRCLDQLYETMQGVTFKQADKVRQEVLWLCFLHEQAGFKEGFGVALRLMMELTKTA